MAQFEPYLNFDGNCSEAFAFYEKVLGGKIEFSMKFSDMPLSPGQPAIENGGIMHTSMTVDGQRLMASDMPPGMAYEKPTGFAVSLSYPTVAEGQRIFDALAEGGTVGMPYGETFWAGGFGMLTDRFGAPWMINAAPKAM